jgi:hypothetical protein
MRKMLTILAAALLVVVGARYIGRERPRPGHDPNALPSRGIAPCGRHCGTGRWLVKTLSDPGRNRVNFTPVTTTVAALAALPAPTSFPEAARLAPVEVTTYEVEAFLAGWHNAADGDIHLILADPANQQATLIAEIPSPECAGACASGLAARYGQARIAFEQLLKRSNPLDKPLVVRVTGVGFFDRPHNQLGAAPNCIELHPVLALTAQ